MNPAEFKTAHEALGLSTDFIAKRVGVHSQMIWRYESPDRATDVPPRAERVMRELLAQFDAAADRVAGECEGSRTIPRYPNLDDFYAAVPELTGWGMAAQGMLIAEVQRRLALPIAYVEQVPA